MMQARTTRSFQKGQSEYDNIRNHSNRSIFKACFCCDRTFQGCVGLSIDVSPKVWAAVRICEDIGSGVPDEEPIGLGHSYLKITTCRHLPYQNNVNPRVTWQEKHRIIGVDWKIRFDCSRFHFKLSMKSRTKFSIVDSFFNCFLFTPLVLLFWFGTYVLIDLVIFNSFRSRFVAAGVTLAFGVTVEFIVTYWQDVFSRWSSRRGFIIVSRLYNYVLAVANICHYRAVEEFYGLWTVNGGLTMAIQTASTSILLLWGMRAGRNITAIPFAISVDTDADGWFSAPTLYQYPVSRPFLHFVDVLLTVLVVSTLGSLHWITLGYVFDATIFPDDFKLSMITSCIVGYASVGFFSILQNTVKSLSQKFDNSTPIKVVLEDLYIFGATAGVILTWKGVGMAVNKLAQEFPVYHGTTDVTGIYANLASFLLLSICYLSGSLVGKGADMDGTNRGGVGVDFSRAYFAHFFDDYIRRTDEVKPSPEAKKTQ